MAVKSDGGDDGGDYYDREGPARVSNTTTSASLRTLLPASLADLRVAAYSPDILSNGIISGGEERDGGGEGDGGDDGGDYYDREGPARVSNTTTSASLRTLLPASLADLRVAAYSPDILSNGIISEGEERDGGGEGDGGDDGGDYYDIY